MQYRKIHIVGGPGSGKSYIARRLSTLYNINSYDLDDIFWDLVKWNQKFDSDNIIRIRKFIFDYESKVVECKDIQDILEIINNT
jgi:adenylate kinase family enzyme